VIVFVITENMLWAVALGYIVLCLGACALAVACLRIAHRTDDIEDTEPAEAMGSEAAWWQEAQAVDVEAWKHLRSQQPSHQTEEAEIIYWPPRRADIAGQQEHRE